MNSCYSISLLVLCITALRVHGSFIIQEEAQQVPNPNVICGGDLSSERGTIQSPKYPKNYRPNTECTWKITVSENHQVALKFHTFELEQSDNCGYDYLEIRDGHESWSPLLGKFCGDHIPNDISSSSNKMTLTFVTDSSSQEAGFNAEFVKDVDECKGDHGCEHECNNTFEGYQCKCRIGFELQSDGRKCVETCGGVIEEANGIVTSPSFPDLYPPSMHCIWEIIAPLQSNVILNFTYFDLEGDEEGCEYDIVDIQSKISENEVLEHGIFCGSRLPPMIISESNILKIEFSSDESEQRSGFNAVFSTDEDECAINNGGCEHNCEDTIGNYTCSCYDDFMLHENLHNCTEIICGEDMTSDGGIVTSLNYPEIYRPDEYCSWKITVPENYQVALKFRSFDVEYTEDCEYDYVEIQDGHESSSPSLGKFCGSDIPNDIFSSSNKMTVTFASDSSGQRTGFSAEFIKNVDECKGDHGCEHECINTLGGYRCQCRAGFVLQPDGSKCIAICGGNVSSDEEILHSPNYPEEYPADMDCVWKITMLENHQVALKFQYFKLEYDDNCEYDYVQIRDGHESSSPLLGKFCGHDIPNDIISSSNKMTVTFVSDSSTQEAGFVIEFIQELNECNRDHECEHECINTIGGYRCECTIGYKLHSDGLKCVESCGGVIEEANGMISSPSYPDLYPPNEKCIWDIIAPTQHRVTLNFTHFDLEGDNKICVYDRVDIQSKLSENKVHNHGTFCGSKLPPVITSESNILRIEFNSDISEQKSGFSAFFLRGIDKCVRNNGGCEHICEYNSGSYNCACNDGFVLHENLHNCMKAICGGDVSSEKGILHSPNYPEKYEPNEKCTWKITVPENHVVGLKFQAFELENDDDCDNDYLEVWDGHNSTSPVLGKFCGDEIPENIFSSSNKIMVEFVTDDYIQEAGFAAGFFKESYGGVIEEAKGSITSPSYPDLYPPNKHCIWEIIAPPQYRITLNFTHFNVQGNSKSCEYDFVDIQSKRPEKEFFKHGTFCGSILPPTITSEGNILRIEFSSDYSVQRSGFAALFNTDMGDCKGNECKREFTKTFGDALLRVQNHLLDALLRKQS